MTKTDSEPTETAETDSEPTETAETESSPAKTGPTEPTTGDCPRPTCDGTLKLMVDKQGNPTPSLTKPLANHKCSDCNLQIWRS